MDAEEVLANCPMISVEEAAPLIGVHDSTVRRHFQELRLRGLATYHDVGRAGHLEQRWIPTGREVRRLYTYPGYVSWWSTEEAFAVRSQESNGMGPHIVTLANFSKRQIKTGTTAMRTPP